MSADDSGKTATVAVVPKGPKVVKLAKPVEDTRGPAIRRPTLGFRVFYFPYKFFNTSGTQASTTNPVASYTYTGGSNAARLTVGINGEYRLTDHLSLGLEFRFHHVNFDETTSILSGIRDPNSSTDDRKPITINSNTEVSYFEFPLLARYYGLRHTGLLSRAYGLGGTEFRYVANIRTGNDYSFPDGSTDYNEVPVSADRNTQFGAAIGIGLRFIDDFNVKVTPEVRFIRWLSTPFQGPAYRSAANEIEAGLGFSF